MATNRIKAEERQTQRHRRRNRGGGGGGGGAEGALAPPILGIMCIKYAEFILYTPLWAPHPVYVPTLLNALNCTNENSTVVIRHISVVASIQPGSSTTQTRYVQKGLVNIVSKKYITKAPRFVIVTDAKQRDVGAIQFSDFHHHHKVFQGSKLVNFTCRLSFVEICWDDSSGKTRADRFCKEGGYNREIFTSLSQLLVLLDKIVNLQTGDSISDRAWSNVPKMVNNKTITSSRNERPIVA